MAQNIKRVNMLCPFTYMPPLFTCGLGVSGEKFVSQNSNSHLLCYPVRNTR